MIEKSDIIELYTSCCPIKRSTDKATILLFAKNIISKQLLIQLNG